MRLVMKFGGTAIDSGKKVIHVANLIKSYRHKRHDEMVGVISAVRGMTDEILSISNSVKRGDKISIMDFIKRTRITHQVIIDESISNRTLRNQAQNVITQLIDELEDILEGIVLLAEVTPRSLDYLMSFGERLSTPIVSFALRDIGLASQYIIGKEVGILTDSNFGEARPLLDTTKLRVAHKVEPLLKEGIIPVVTGFIGADQNGNTTTLGRGGSDYTATIIAASINADEIWLWSDVDGLMTADPKIVNSAKVLREVSYAEAMEMALFGAVARKNINVMMITQGSSELNLAFVVNDNDCEEAVRALHDEFGLANTE